MRDLWRISSTLSLSSSNVFTMCCLYFSTSFMWSLRQRFFPWKREDVRRFTSCPQTSHVTFSMPQDRQILPTPITMGKVPGVDSSFPHMAHFMIFPVECCMVWTSRKTRLLKEISLMDATTKVLTPCLVLWRRNRVQTSRNLGRAISYVLIVVVILVGAELVVSSALGSSPVYVVVSGSMIPALEIGDLVVAQGVPFSSIRVGQVIIYVRPDSLGQCDGETIVHRVVGITSQGLVTQGDNRITNPSPDSWSPIPSACVKGVVVLAVPYLGLISMVIPPPYNYVFVGLIIIFVFLSELKGGKRDGESGGGQMPSETSSTVSTTASALVFVSPLE